MGLISDFRDFAMRGNVVDLAVGVVIGAAFGGITTSLVTDIIMPPIGKVIGGLDFSNLYISLSDKVDAANADLGHKVAEAAATQPAVAGAVTSMVGKAADVFSTAGRIPLVDARKLGPVIAYGNFITTLINFLIIAFCIFLVVRLMAAAQKRFKKEEAAAAVVAPPPEVVLLTEIRDLLQRP